MRKIARPPERPMMRTNQSGLSFMNEPVAACRRVLILRSSGNPPDSMP
jgi:hypothetical protein